MRAWYRKFACAITGILWAIRTQNSFWVHGFFMLAAIAVGSWLRIERWQWVAIVLAIGSVLAAESFNTAIELIVKSVHPEHDANVGRALDIAAGAVLITACGAVVIGLITLGPPLIDQLIDWGLFPG